MEQIFRFNYLLSSLSSLSYLSYLSYLSSLSSNTSPKLDTFIHPLFNDVSHHRGIIRSEENSPYITSTSDFDRPSVF
jgi:hypothetical protein